MWNKLKQWLHPDHITRGSIKEGFDDLPAAVRYAGANRLEITITPQGGGQRWQFENDGPPPADPAITPGGGLTAIQRRVMQAGGTMEVQARPRYRLCVNLPKEETI